MFDKLLEEYRYFVNKITKTLFLLNYAFYIWDVFLSNYKTNLLLTDYQRTEVQPVCGLVVVWYPDVRDAGRPKPLQWLWWRWPVLVYLQPTATLPTLHHHGSQAHTDAGSSSLPQPSYQVWVSPTSQLFATDLVTFKFLNTGTSTQILTLKVNSKYQYQTQRISEIDIENRLISRDN